MKKLVLISIVLLNINSFCQNLIASDYSGITSNIQTSVKFQKVTTIKSLYFETNKSVLNENSLEALKTILGVMLENPEMKISLNAYSDLSETDKNVSLKRAIVSKKYLVANGVAANRLKINDLGNTKQLSEVNAEQFERRVEFEIE